MLTLNEDLQRIATDTLELCRNAGLDESDQFWQAVGQCMRYGREQGVIGDELTPEMNAALQVLVRQAMRASKEQPALTRCTYCGQLHQAEQVEYCPMKPRGYHPD